MNHPRKIVHPQPPTSVAKENYLANSIVNGKDKQKISRAIDMIESEKTTSTYYGRRVNFFD